MPAEAISPSQLFRPFVPRTRLARRESVRRMNPLLAKEGAGGRLLARSLCCVALLLFASACRQDMQNQPKYTPYRPSGFFEDGRDARPLVADTVARGHLDEDVLLYTGKSGDAFADLFPFPVTQDILHRGQERYNIFCSPCHDRTGKGGGMIVQRGYRRPPAFHIDRLRQQPAGYFFDVITRGFGVMPNYAQQIPPRDRWAIVAYVRALQLSQHATLADVRPEEQQQLMHPAPKPGSAHE